MEEKDIRTALLKIGLSQLEVDCYIALVKRSPQRASDLSKNFSVPKATVLLALQRLTDELGVVRRIRTKNTFLFSVEDINNLLAYLNREEESIVQKKKTLTNLLPQLRSMHQYDVNKPKIFYYEGREGVHKALEQVLEEAETYDIYGSVEDDLNYLPEVYPDYYDRRVAKRIHVRAIVPALPLSIPEIINNEIKHQRAAHLVPADWNYNLQVNFYKNTVLFMSYEENFALMIKSKPIAECLLRIFQLAYERAGDYDKEIRAKLANTKKD